MRTVIAFPNNKVEMFLGVVMCVDQQLCQKIIYYNTNLFCYVLQFFEGFCFGVKTVVHAVRVI
jgi:hypothetical protein